MRSKLLSAVLFSFLFSQNLRANFLWGVASASFQVEGSPAPSDWYEWTHTAGKIEDKTNADTIIDFWNRYEEDIKWAAELGSKAYRISLAWERIEPSEGAFDLKAIEHYAAIIKTIRKYKMEPIVTLHHFVLPLWLSKEGGLTAKNFPQIFARYAETCVDKLSDPKTGASYWMTFNEPNILVISGYLAGEWPPGYKGSILKGFKALDQMIAGHRLSYTRIKALNKPNVKVGMAHHWRDIQSLHDRPVDIIGRQLGDKYSNHYFVDGVQKGSSTLDYIGINYYGRTIVAGSFKFPFITTPKGSGDVNDIGWEIYPHGLTETLREVYKRYKLPMIISENGLADEKDAKRSQFLLDHVKAMKVAMDEGIPVFGYLHWSITDNFEWAKGLSPRFGLIEIDYKTNERRPRPSFYTYQKIISETKLSPLL